MYNMFILFSYYSVFSSQWNVFWSQTYCVCVLDSWVWTLLGGAQGNFHQSTLAGRGWRCHSSEGGHICVASQSRLPSLSAVWSPVVLLLCTCGWQLGSWTELYKKQPFNKVRCFRMQNRGRIMPHSCHSGAETRKRKQKELRYWIDCSTQRIANLAALIQFWPTPPTPPPGSPVAGMQQGANNQDAACCRTHPHSSGGSG